MQQISKKLFFELLTGTASAKIGAVPYQGNKVIDDSLVNELTCSLSTETYRNVVHRQSNAIKFEDNSWLYFEKPKSCDSRKAFIYEINGETFISLVDHRPKYNNAFGTLINEQIFALIYKLAK